MPETNEFTEAILEVVAEYREMGKDAKESHTPPFMAQSLSTNEAASKLQTMTTQQRQGLVDRLGMEKVMELVRLANA